MAHLLTPSCVRAIYDADTAPVPGFEQPTLQVLATKPINNNQNAAANATERWRVVLSDGTNFIQAMLATQLNPLVHSGEMSKGKLVKVHGYSMSRMKEKKYQHILSLHYQLFVGDANLVWKGF
jgi:replication factor A1